MPLVLSVSVFSWLHPWVSKPGWMPHCLCLMSLVCNGSLESTLARSGPKPWASDILDRCAIHLPRWPASVFSNLCQFHPLHSEFYYDTIKANEPNLIFKGSEPSSNKMYIILSETIIDFDICSAHASSVGQSISSTDHSSHSTIQTCDACFRWLVLHPLHPSISHNTQPTSTYTWICTPHRQDSVMYWVLWICRWFQRLVLRLAPHPLHPSISHNKQAISVQQG